MAWPDSAASSPAASCGRWPTRKRAACCRGWPRTPPTTFRRRARCSPCCGCELRLRGRRLAARQAREELAEVAGHVVVGLLEMILAGAAPHADRGDAPIGGDELHLSGACVHEPHLHLRPRAAGAVGAPHYA